MRRDSQLSHEGPRLHFVARPRGWTIHVEGRPSGPVDPMVWMDLIERHSGVLTSPQTYVPGEPNLTSYTVSLAISAVGTAIETAIGLVRPADPHFEVTSLEAVTYEEEDRME